MGTEFFSPGVKWPGREADHSPPSSAMVKNEWSYTPAPPVCFHVVLKWTFALGTGWGRSLDWINLAQDMFQWLSFVNTLMNLRLP